MFSKYLWLMLGILFCGLNIANLKGDRTIIFSRPKKGVAQPPKTYFKFGNYQFPYLSKIFNGIGMTATTCEIEFLDILHI